MAKETLTETEENERVIIIARAQNFSKDKDQMKGVYMQYSHYPTKFYQRIENINF